MRLSVPYSQLMELSALEQVIELLETSRRDVVESVAELADSEASRKPAPGKWSVLECLEHIVFVEDVYLGWLQNATLLDAPKRDVEREAWITARASNRDWDWQAPRVALPTGRFETVPQALREFDLVRERTIATATARESDLFSLQAKHSLLGIMNGVELLRLAAGHATRHAAQIREVRASLS